LENRNVGALSLAPRLSLLDERVENRACIDHILADTEILGLMDGQMNGRMDRTDRQRKRQMNRRTDGWTDRLTDKGTER